MVIPEALGSLKDIAVILLEDSVTHLCLLLEKLSLWEWHEGGGGE